MYREARKPMRLALNTAMIGLGLVMAAGSGWGQSESGTAPAKAGGHKPRINAALMLSGGESSRCQLRNVNDAYVVTVSATNNPKLTRYIGGGGQSCTVLPITVRTGTQIHITGVLQDIPAIPGGAAAGDLASVSEDCFNVEGFSVGLAADSGSEGDPLDPADII